MNVKKSASGKFELSSRHEPSGCHSDIGSRVNKVLCFVSPGGYMRKLGFGVAVWLVIPIVLFGQRHPFTADDAAPLRRAQAVAVSPDGKTVLYKVMFGGSKGPDQTEWKSITPSGATAQPLTIPDKFQPSGFTADGKALYGTYEVNKIPQLATFLLVPSGTPGAAAATPVPLTSLPRGIHCVAISPDGRRYAIVADPRLPDPLADMHTVIEAAPASLYVINADGSGGAWWCPTLKDIGTMAWSPDGNSLALQSQTPKIGFHDVRSSIDACAASGTRHLATIENSTSGIGWINSGKNLVFLSTTSPSSHPITSGRYRQGVERRKTARLRYAAARYNSPWTPKGMHGSARCAVFRLRSMRSMETRSFLPTNGPKALLRNRSWRPRSLRPLLSALSPSQTPNMHLTWRSPTEIRSAKSRMKETSS